MTPRPPHGAGIGARAALLILCLLAGTATSAAPGGIRPFEARYALGNGSLTVGEVEMRLEADGARWRFSSQSEPTGMFALLRKDRTRETSWLADDPDDIRPLAYEYQQSGSREQKLRSEFDWTDAQVTTDEVGEAQRREALQPGTQDRISVLLKLVQAARDRQSQVRIDVNEKGRPRDWVFSNQGEERIQTAAGRFLTVKLVQAHEPGGRYTVTWLAPSLDFLPVRMDQYKKDKLKVRMDLEHLQRDGRVLARKQPRPRDSVGNM